MKTTLLMSISALIITTALLSLTTASAQPSSQVKTNSSTTDSLGGYYTCSMHPEVHLPTPGDCPKCGMTLIYKKNSPVPATDSTKIANSKMQKKM